MLINVDDNIRRQSLYEPDQLLDYLHKNGIVDLGDVENQMRRKEKEEKIKAVHPYAITKNGNRWQTYVKDESKQDNRKQIKKTNRDDLLDYLINVYDIKDDANYKSKVSLAELYPQWKEHKALHVKETCMNRIERSWISYYKDTPIVTQPIRSLSKLQLDEWVHTWIKSKSLTKTEYYNMSLIMRQVLDYAVDLDIISKNPFRLVKINGRRVFRRSHKKDASTQVFTDSQVQKICELALDDFRNNKKLKYELAPLAVIFALKTGQRPSEVCADKYDDIELDKLHVKRMLEFETGRVVESFKGTFDAFEDRYIYLTPDAMSIIDLCRERQIEKGANSSNYIFSLEEEINSGLWEAIENRIEKYSLIACGAKRSLTKARKTYISTALDAGINPDTVRRTVGHRDLKTTLNRYYFDRSNDFEQHLQFINAFDKAKIFHDQKCPQVSSKEKRLKP